MSWKNLFSETLRKLLEAVTQQTICGNQNIYKTVQELKYGQRRGIWLDVAKELNVNPQEIRDYYHNTWILQFFTSVSDYRDEIRQLVNEMSDMDQDKQIVTAFLLRYKNLNFNLRQVQQAVNVASKKKNVLQCEQNTKQNSKQPKLNSQTIKNCSKQQQNDENLMSRVSELLKDQML